MGHHRLKLHKLPAKLVPEAVTEMLEAKDKEGASKAYMKVLRVYLNNFKTSFQSHLRSVRTEHAFQNTFDTTVFALERVLAQTVGEPKSLRPLTMTTPHSESVRPPATACPRLRLVPSSD